MVKIKLAATILILTAISACGQSESASVVQAQVASVASSGDDLQIVANNFTDATWRAGVSVSNGHSNIFYFLTDPLSRNPVSLGKKLSFSRSGNAIVTKVTSAVQGASWPFLLR